jgi:hypothetical protein
MTVLCESFGVPAAARAGIISPRCVVGCLLTTRTGRKVMEWFSQKTSIAGTQIPNWALVLGAIIIIWLIYRSFF